MVSLSRGTLIEVSRSQVGTVIRSIVSLLDGISRVCYTFRASKEVPSSNTLHFSSTKLHLLGVDHL